MLKNSYLLAKIGADTAENTQNPAEILTNFDNTPRVVRVEVRVDDVHEVLREHGARVVSGMWTTSSFFSRRINYS